MVYTCKCGATYADSDVAKFIQHVQQCSGVSKEGEGERAQPTPRGDNQEVRQVQAASFAYKAKNAEVGRIREKAAEKARQIAARGVVGGAALTGDDSNAINCPECGDCFTRRSSLKRHVVKQHPEKDVDDIMKRASKNPYSKCPHCGSVESAAHLQRHIGRCPVFKASQKPQASGNVSGVSRGVQEVRSSQGLNVSRDSLVSRAGNIDQASNTMEEQTASLSLPTASTSRAMAIDFPITPETMDFEYEIKKEIKMEPSDE